MKKCIPLIACIIFVLLIGTAASLKTEASSLNSTLPTYLIPTSGLTDILSEIADAAEGVSDIIGGIDTDEIGDAFGSLIGGLVDRFKKDQTSETQTSDFQKNNKNPQSSSPNKGNDGKVGFVSNEPNQTASVSSRANGKEDTKPDNSTASKSSPDDVENNQSSKRAKQIALKRGLIITSCVLLAISACVILFLLSKSKKTVKKSEYIDDEEFFGEANEDKDRNILN
ncbi:MAG: hypothetical protein BWY46_01581 [Firmicutes bacterium ADurb.Bin300]|nr:MAG: hypothetical protein BWY46_01581 [Firmicutes bacterium ADurb.Bin300]